MIRSVAVPPCVEVTTTNVVVGIVTVGRAAHAPRASAVAVAMIAPPAVIGLGALQLGAPVVLAWVGAVVAEFIGASQGLGALIIAAQGSMDTPLMFAVLTLITLLGLASYKLANMLEQRLLRSQQDF